MRDTPITDKLLLKINEGRVYENEGPMAELARSLERIARTTAEAITSMREAALVDDWHTFDAEHDNALAAWRAFEKENT